MLNEPANPWNLRGSKYGALRWLVHLLAWLPPGWILWDYLHDNLSVNPIQTVEQRLGRIALILLLSSLACTPLQILTGWRGVVRLRRPLGVYAFLYAAAHVFVLIGLDYQFRLRLLLRDFSGKPYIWVGAAAFALLLPLAVTSMQWWMRLLGSNWKRLHRLVYLAAPLAVVHYAWAKKGNLAALEGDITLPLVAGLVLVLLLVVRVPPVRRWIIGLRQRQSGRPESKGSADADHREETSSAIAIALRSRNEQTRRPSNLARCPLQRLSGHASRCANRGIARPDPPSSSGI